MRQLISTVALLALVLGGCTTGSGRSVIGSQAASGAGEPRIGVVEGGLLGEDFGRSLDDADRQVAVQAEYEALEYGRAGQPTRWTGDDGATRGEISVGATYEVNRLDCREYTHRATIEGRTRVARGTACREPGGNWRIVG